ncbi:undecaprenyl-phosphate glucose phosphotransferase [Ectothiorhodospira shaposhnikovii]|uniref:undecaprenyl-phosphate glucose phosphotransferase n=1 Tax=Ectothiorhodospira shaposhnikovii TaxID=1054 RepID=UPI001906AF67|nr:undecaprenyl-phosphate glucose phosphotransferase [Ectothiorhodospira shaposhnikovii]MBK1672627.1 undecaprenyl-phosphate glucose phosphotransferase [Ectothiorhodospira shaposhnikovii]
MKLKVYRGILKEHASLLNGILQALDWLVVVLAGWMAHWIYLGSPSLGGGYDGALLVGMLLTALIFPRFHLYRAWRGAPVYEELRLLTLAWGFVVVVLATLAFVVQIGEAYSRAWAILWATGAWVGLVLGRITLRGLLNWMRAHGHNQRLIVIVGEPDLARDVASRLSASSWTGLRIVGFFCDEDQATGHAARDLPLIGDVAQMPEFVRRNKVDQVWIALPLKEEDRVREILHRLRHSTADIRYVPDLFGLRLINHSIEDVAGLPVLNLSVSPIEGANRVVKELEDRILALLVLLASLPLVLLITIGVKLSSPGPVIFKQRRHGWDGREIKVYKFRTMHLHRSDNGEVVQATPDDPRVTPFGAFLRRTSLDELPQFLNVLQGRMSIVGPRPHALAHNHYYMNQVDHYMLRHKVKPGITGWAQVNGYRGRTDTLEKMRKRVEYDLYYIENWSFWFDLKIIFMTVLTVWRQKNAY